MHIPTSLLAMVDSSIGGKTGYNLKYGKNLVGTFYHPDLILTDINFLKTLDKKEYLSGLSEAIKSALIWDKDLFELIEAYPDKLLKRDSELLIKVVSKSQNIKIKVVSEDEKETGIRAILNFGHTLGHAVEKLSRWKIKHGFAVAKGIAFESYLSLLKGYLSKDKTRRIINTLKNYGYSLRLNPSKELVQSFYFDKKRKYKEVEWVLLKNIGKASFGELLDEPMINLAIDSYNDFLKG